MEMDMPNFSMLSLNEVDMPVEVPDFADYFNNNNSFNILDCETMEILLIHLYANENPYITFEELQQRLVEFYFHEATTECISKHLMELMEFVNNDIMVSIYEKVLSIDSYDTNNNLNLNILIEFINCQYGNSYLEDIYNQNCITI